MIAINVFPVFDKGCYLLLYEHKVQVCDARKAAL